jgi:hypothetical protein
MAAGDIKISSIKVGGMDLVKSGEASIVGFNIYEDILNPYGPVAELRIIDPSDALTKNRINGSFDQDVEIRFSGDDNILSSGGGGNFKFKMYQNKNLNDQSKQNVGSGRNKQYDIRCVSPEFLNAQGNHIEKSFKGKTSEVVQHILKEGFKTKRQMDIGTTKGNRRIVISKMHPLDALKRMNTEHVSEKYESSTFALFQQGDNQGEHKYVFKTFEELFEKQPVVKLKQSTNLNFDSKNQTERQNSIMWFRPSKNFDSGPRALDKTEEYTVDLTSHKVVATNHKKQSKFKFADSQGVYDQSPSYAKSLPVRYIHDKANNKDKHTTSEAKTKRAAFLSHLAQNSAELETYYNPNIKLGSMIELDIPKKANSGTQEGEGQFNGKCLVVAIRTKYRIAAEPPHCTMVLRVVKASFKRGGGGQG